MKLLNTVLIILVILLSLYIYFRIVEYYNILESFDNTQNSSSTYFQNTVDSDQYMTNLNTFNNITPINNLSSDFNWNGIWNNSSNTLNAQFLQQNDKVIIVLSSIIIDYSTSPNDGLFIGIGQLNLNKTVFNLINTIKNDYTNSSLNLSPSLNSTNYSLSGILNNNQITIYSNNGPQIILTKNISFTDSNNPSDYPYLNTYIKSISPFVRSYPNVSNSYYEHKSNTCPEGTNVCNNINNGLTTTTWNPDNPNGNACGTPDLSGNCTQTTCFLNPPIGSNLPKCPINSTNLRYLNYGAPTTLMNTSGNNSLNICNLTQYFSDNMCNSCILCYVTNIGNVQTLSYQFFGVLPEQSSLVTHYDIMNSLLNKNILPNYRNNLSNANTNTSLNNNIKNSISFTNCVENINNSSNIISNCLINCQTYVNKYIPVNSNNMLLPTIWQINFNNSYNFINSCTITLSTSQLYNTPVKYVNINDNGETNLSLYFGGNNQELKLENTNILSSVSIPPFVAFTCNIRNNKGLYLLPGNDYNGFSNNSNIISFNQSPNENGKWLILGFSLNNMNDLSNILNNINF